MYKNWINGLLGLVVIGAAFMNLSVATLTWTLSIVGVIIAVNSFWSIAMEEDESQSSQSHKLQGQG